ncbi:MAG: AAA family ATPase [Deltaproteobacteria bacterium]|nr:AAA family ATPase [Deltaproteobacteria bacterium]
MLKRVHFAGIKSLADVTIDLERFTVLVGPNGCGKSTVLNHIELLCRGSFPQGSDGHALGAAGRAIQEAKATTELTADSTDGMTWRGESDRGELEIRVPPWTGTNWMKSAEVSFRLVNSARRTLPPGPGGPPDQSSRMDSALALAGSWSAQRLRLEPDAIAAPSPVEVTTLSPNGQGLPTILKDFASDNPDGIQSLKKDLTRVVPPFRDLKFGKGKIESPDKRSQIDVTTLSLEMLGAGRVSASTVSDGTLVSLALLTVAHHRDLPNIVLMDDIDHGLHLGAQHEIIAAIRRVMEVRPELQVICTTHSPILLDSFDISEVRVMALDGKGHTRVKPLSEHPTLDAWRSGYTSGELWANLGEEWVASG